MTREQRLMELVERLRRSKDEGSRVCALELEAILNEESEGWLPIESAPKDGSQLLIWTKRIGFSVVTHDVDEPMPTEIVSSGHRFLVDDGKFGPYPIRGDYPEKWQPLPVAPTRPADGSEES